MSTDTEIFVAVPSGYGLVLHLHSPGYQPGGEQSARKRDLAYPVALCNNRSIKHDTLIPLRDGLNLRRTEVGTGPAWRWCRVCIGHAVAIEGLEQRVLTWIATGKERP